MLTSTQRYTMAILVREAAGAPPFADEYFCRRLSVESARHGLRIVVIPIPDSLNERCLRKGYIYDWKHQKQWQSAHIPVIDLVMNRCLRPLTRIARQQIEVYLPPACSLRKRSWSAALPGKWDIYQALSGQSQLRRLLVPTSMVRSSIPWEIWLARWPKGLFFKPVSGTHGKNTFRLSIGETPSTWIVEGRNTGNEHFHLTFQQASDVSSWLESHQAVQKMIVQPYLELSHLGRVFDIRALVQKNGHGRWTLTGCMVREGPEGSLTSNLHGGGTAYPADEYLTERYGTDQAALLLQQIRHSAALIPPLLESRFGRLAELGLDFGTDTGGRLWMIEVNSKPGRTSFAKAKDEHIHALTYSRPLAYARYLLQQFVLTDVSRPMKMPNSSSKAGLKRILIPGGQGL
ncbi:YheC/YheD family protein [Paenibacillus barcinonensis]|uniref:YheC/D-like protein n=1 Tax=Paenibacillus barcinonensis TaxID=198119 RepID=A0A2V4WJK6_PAEBA|nr:YheC/YheD family protein [Paenibacillus barcinonensis]PYE52548.1 YheC/D-like protein [Paenibacillus barcinonensis]QKS59300.1 YheC/YheD family protein [Paenibacillus barcinonensis]